jgi:hypothetical protein
MPLTLPGTLRIVHYPRMQAVAERDRRLIEAFDTPDSWGQCYRPTKHSGQAAQVLVAAGRTWPGVEPGSDTLTEQTISSGE